MAITIQNVRLSYVHLFQPRASSRPNSDPKYSVTCLLPKSEIAGKAAIDQAIAQATEAGAASKWGGIRPQRVAHPVYDGDGLRPGGEAFPPECRGHWVFTASSQVSRQPFIVDGQLQPIIDPRQVYSGCYANVNIHFFPYAVDGKKGVGCGINGVQFVRDGEPLGGGVSVQEAFGMVTPQPQQYAPQPQQYAPQPQQYAPQPQQYAPNEAAAAGWGAPELPF